MRCKLGSSVAMASCLFAMWGCSATPGTSRETPAALTALSSVAGHGDRGLKMVAELPPPLAVTSGVAQPVAISDVLEISVFQVPDLARTVQVDDRGYVSLPLIGAVQASGKSVQMLQGDIETAYAASYLQSPNVSVFVKESAARRVTVDGEVRRAGVYPLPPGASLLDAVALAGGLTAVADPSKVYVFRRVGDVNYVTNYKVDNIRQGSGRNPPVYGGDVVVVFASQSRVMLQSLKEALGVATSVGRLSVLVP
ncbi:polysaccharide biosynthesis/export family protein [Mesorhizobium sp. KR1-2]|uniref:polysaccharide biosynthesis/export family protein n=1 Tax=Mesorhizobium sp. KR1-2 TaxID=3156609 RepID=UPI0032B61849